MLGTYFDAYLFFEKRHLFFSFRAPCDTSKKNTTSNSSMKPHKISFEISQKSLQKPIQITPETLFENFTDVEKSYFDPLKKILERSSTSNFHNQGASAQPQNNDSKFPYGYSRYTSKNFKMKPQKQPRSTFHHQTQDCLHEISPKTTIIILKLHNI